MTLKQPPLSVIWGTSKGLKAKIDVLISASGGTSPLAEIKRKFWSLITTHF